MGEHYNLDIRVHLKCFFKSSRVHIPRISFGVDKHWDAMLVNDRVKSSRKGHIGAENSSVLDRSDANRRLSIKLLSGDSYA